jgi:hypothetical protein
MNDEREDRTHAAMHGMQQFIISDETVNQARQIYFIHNCKLLRDKMTTLPPSAERFSVG